MTPAEVRDVLAQVNYRMWNFHVDMDGDRMYLQVRFDADGRRQHGRKWLLSPHMTRSEVVQTAFKAVITAEEHEAREHFRYRGAAVFGPHFDVDVLAVVCIDRDALDVRPGEAA